jgi:hypothetical protein
LSYTQQALRIPSIAVVFDMILGLENKKPIGTIVTECCSVCLTSLIIQVVLSQTQVIYRNNEICLSMLGSLNKMMCNLNNLLRFVF